MQLIIITFGQFMILPLEKALEECETAYHLQDYGPMKSQNNQFRFLTYVYFNISKDNVRINKCIPGQMDSSLFSAKGSSCLAFEFSQLIVHNLVEQCDRLSLLELLTLYQLLPYHRLSIDPAYDDQIVLSRNLRYYWLQCLTLVFPSQFPTTSPTTSIIIWKDEHISCNFKFL